MKTWLQFLTEKNDVRWKYDSDNARWKYGSRSSAVKNSQVTSDQIKIPTAGANDETEYTSGGQSKSQSPSLQSGEEDSSIEDKVRWLDTMVQFINSKRIHQQEFNTKIDGRLQRLEKINRLPPQKNSVNGVVW